MPRASKADRDVDDRGAKKYEKQVAPVKNVPSLGPKKNRDIICQRCGSCCHVDMVAYISPEDIQRWEKERRHDIIA